MQDDLQNKQQQIQAELRGDGLSRRGFMDRIKLLGVGFGAAFLLGVKSADAHMGDETVSLTSSNPALNDIIGGPKDEHSEMGSDGRVQEAWYRRFYARGYRRWWHRRRWYRRW